MIEGEHLATNRLQDGGIFATKGKLSELKDFSIIITPPNDGCAVARWGLPNEGSPTLVEG